MMFDRWRLVAEWTGFQFVWLVCVLGAAKGQSLPSLIAAAVFVSAMLATQKWDTRECITILASGVVGFMAESVLVATGLVRYSTPWPHPQLAPVWIIALWIAFGATLATFASLLGRDFVAKASVIGSIAGPLAYAAGAKMGAIELADPSARTYLAIAAMWAIALPGLLLMRQALRHHLSRT